MERKIQPHKVYKSETLPDPSLIPPTRWEDLVVRIERDGQYQEIRNPEHAACVGFQLGYARERLQVCDTKLLSPWILWER